MGGGGGGRLFEAGRLLTFSAFRMGAYSRWALIRGWALIRINTVSPSAKDSQPSNTLLAYFVRFNYKTDLIHNLTGSARIIPVFNYSHMEGKSGAVKSIQIPPLKG